MDFFSDIVAQLAQEKVASPRLEAREIFAFVLQKDIAEIYSGCEVNYEQKQQIEKLVKKRLSHCPLDKILGKKGFYKNEFITNENVLSPRPDTEILVEKALELLPLDSTGKILDLGTGSGCIIESILAEREKMGGVAVDISAQALQTAQENAANLNLQNRLNFINAGWFDKDFLQHFSTTFQMVVSNPPYIPRLEIEQLEPEVKNYDPMLALDGGNSGYDCYEKIAELAPFLLSDNAYILLEVGQGQALRVAQIFMARQLELCCIVPDLAGIERCVILQKKVA